MVVNQTKTKTAVFNTATSKDFYPRIANSQEIIYENTEEFKLLGVDFVSHSRDGVRWDKYIQQCIKQAYSKMWILKRLAELGVSTQDLLMSYLSRVRVQLEQNVPLWHFSISSQLRKKLENVQKACLFIILGQRATSDYHRNLAMLNLEPLVDRRLTLCKNFGRKTIKHPVHSQMFTFNRVKHTRAGRKVIVPKANTARYNKSAIPSLARLINSM